ncbi:MAG: hypothetical protein ACYDCK_06310 [Thermoplasmatota archaeon]
MSEATLYEEALVMSSNKNLADVATLLEWAHGATDLKERIAHIEQAIALLTDMRDQMRALKVAQRGF